MKIAVPMAQGQMCMHFGHCEKFAVLDVDDNGAVIKREDVDPPEHVPGVIPKFVADLGVNVMLAGGMGARAIDILEQRGVKVLVGCPNQSPEALAELYCKGQLTSGANACGGGHGHGDGGGCGGHHH